VGRTAAGGVGDCRATTVDMRGATVGWRGAGTIFGGAAGVGAGGGTRAIVGIVCGRLEG